MNNAYKTQQGRAAQPAHFSLPSIISLLSPLPVQHGQLRPLLQAQHWCTCLVCSPPPVATSLNRPAHLLQAEIPSVGLGTWRASQGAFRLRSPRALNSFPVPSLHLISSESKPGEVAKAVEVALKAGYRHLSVLQLASRHARVPLIDLAPTERSGTALGRTKTSPRLARASGRRAFPAPSYSSRLRVSPYSPDRCSVCQPTLTSPSPPLSADF
jgi:hypothetical protein